jgi:hypothetical protein
MVLALVIACTMSLSVAPLLRRCCTSLSKVFELRRARASASPSMCIWLGDGIVIGPFAACRRRSTQLHPTRRSADRYPATAARLGRPYAAPYRQRLDRQNRRWKRLSLLSYFCHFVMPPVFGTDGQNPRYEMLLAGTCPSRTVDRGRRSCRAGGEEESPGRNAGKCLRG